MTTRTATTARRRSGTATAASSATGASGEKLPLPEALGALAEREFRLLFAGRVVSLAGSAIAPIALAFAVLDLTGSASDLGFVLAAGWAPQIVFLLAGGVWADRLPRNLIMVGSNVLSGAAQGVVALLLLTGQAQLWHLVALSAARGVASSFFFPASQGLVPQTVSAGRLQQANALLRLSLNGTNIGGAAVGGLLVAALGPGWAIAFDAATYVASAAVLARMRIVAAARAGGRDFLHELREGWGEFRSRTWLWTIVAQAAIGNVAVMGGFIVLGPVVAKRELGGAAPWGAILAAQSAGLVLGGLVALRIRPRRQLLVGTAALALMSPALALLALGSPAVVVAAGALLAGVGVELFSVFWDTSLQQHIPLEVLSRVSSYDALGSWVAIPIGLSVVGPVSDAIGVSETLWIAVAVQLSSLLAVLGVRDVRELRRVDAPALTPSAA